MKGLAYLTSIPAPDISISSGTYESCREEVKSISTMATIFFLDICAFLGPSLNQIVINLVEQRFVEAPSASQGPFP